MPERLSLEKLSFKWPQLTIESAEFNELRPQGENGSIEWWKLEFKIEDDSLFELVSIYIRVPNFLFDQKHPKYTFFIKFRDSNRAKFICNHFKDKLFKVMTAEVESSESNHSIAYIDTKDKEKFFVEFNEFLSKTTMSSTIKERMDLEIKQAQSAYNWWKANQQDE